MARWNRDELILALSLYHQTPFGKQHSRHPPIIKLAEELGRTPGSVNMKLNNFTSLDPAENGKGLPGASKLDREIWNEFFGKFESLADESEFLIDRKEQPSGPTTRRAITTQRRHQKFFRKCVLGSYDNRCCITGIPVPQLLRASHIVPWSQSEKHRLDPTNGLCLAGTFDLAFDQFLISFDENLSLVIGPTLQKALAESSVAKTFSHYIGRSIRLPEKNHPNPNLLNWHFGRLQ